MEKSEAIKLAKPYFQKENVNIIYITGDKQIFSENAKTYAEAHRKKADVPLHIITRDDLSGNVEVDEDLRLKYKELFGRAPRKTWDDQRVKDEVENFQEKKENPIEDKKKEIEALKKEVESTKIESKKESLKNALNRAESDLEKTKGKK